MTCKHNVGPGCIQCANEAYLVSRHYSGRREPQLNPALNAWNWLAKNTDLELSYSTCEDNWAVHRLSGWINDPDWKLIGEGPTPLEAVLAAMAAAGGE